MLRYASMSAKQNLDKTVFGQALWQKLECFSQSSKQALATAAKPTL